MHHGTPSAGTPQRGTVVGARVGALWRPTMPEIEVIAEQWPEQIAFVPSTPAGDPAPATEARADLDVLVGLPFHLTGELLDEMPNVRLIHILGHGVDPLFAPELLGRIRERGITVARTGCASTAAAEYAIMAMVTLARRITPMHYDVLANGGWSLERKVRRMEGGLGGELAGKRLLIVGYGGIGRELAPRAKAFGMEVTVLRRHPASERSGPSVDRFAGMGDLDRELSRTDHLVLAVPLTEETNGVIDAARVSLLRPATCVVNLARGEVVDEAALLRALEAGWIGGLALDVWRHEVDPTVPLPGSEWLARNLLATPHISGLTVEARLRSLETIGESLRRFLRGEKLAHVVDLELGY